MNHISPKNCNANEQAIPFGDPQSGIEENGVNHKFFLRMLRLKIRKHKKE